MVRRGRGAGRCAVRDVSFEARFHEMLYIVGPSGSGKTTLLSMISGHPAARRGHACASRTPTSGALDENAHRRLPPQHGRLRVPGLPPVPAPHDGRERRHPADPQAARLGRGDARGAAKYLEVVGLSARARAARRRKLSGGEQQRVAIARAIASAPGHPDLRRADGVARRRHGPEDRRVREAARCSNDQRCIVIVTHDDRIYEFADRILHMEDGRIVDGSRRERRCVTRSSSRWSSLGVARRRSASAYVYARPEQAAAAGLQPGARTPTRRASTPTGSSRATSRTARTSNIYPEVAGDDRAGPRRRGADASTQGTPLVAIDDSVQRAIVEQQKAQAEAAQALLDELTRAAAQGEPRGRARAGRDGARRASRARRTSSTSSSARTSSRPSR